MLRSDHVALVAALRVSVRRDGWDSVLDPVAATRAAELALLIERHASRLGDGATAEDAELAQRLSDTARTLVLLVEAAQRDDPPRPTRGFPAPSRGFPPIVVPVHESSAGKRPR